MPFIIYLLTSMGTAMLQLASPMEFLCAVKEWFSSWGWHPALRTKELGALWRQWWLKVAMAPDWCHSWKIYPKREGTVSGAGATSAICHQNSPPLWSVLGAMLSILKIKPEIVQVQPSVLLFRRQKPPGSLLHGPYPPRLHVWCSLVLKFH